MNLPSYPAFLCLCIGLNCNNPKSSSLFLFLLGSYPIHQFPAHLFGTWCFLFYFLFVCLKVAHHAVKDQLLGYIYNGFLVPVMAPALHKVIYWLFICLDLLSNPWSKPVLLCVLMISWLWRKSWPRQLIWSSFCGISPTPPSSRRSLFSSSSIAMTMSTSWTHWSAESTLLFRFAQDLFAMC